MFRRMHLAFSAEMVFKTEMAERADILRRVRKEGGWRVFMRHSEAEAA